MKKIIALAVASAFVAPAFAADVTISGETEMTYTSTEGSQDTAENADNVVVVTASEEVEGVSISTSIVLDADALNDADDYAGDGSSLTVSAGGITLAMGDVSGAMDAVGDYTDVSPALGGFNLDGGDHSYLVTLPTMNGVTVYASMSPQGAAYDGATADASGFGAKFAFAGGEVYYGQEDVGDVTNTAYGVKYSAAGFMVAYERGTDNNGSNADEVSTGLAVTYKMGDILVGAEAQEKKEDGSAANEDETVTFLEYNLGSNVDVYIANLSNGVAADNDATTVGIEYKF